MRFRLKINVLARALDVPLGTALLNALRDELGLTAARYGCGQGSCGACYVLVRRCAVPSCIMTVAEAAGKSLVTVEGLATNGTLHRRTDRRAL
jgi:aerobic-type carbon monoxide dehydrogenase small subunit (CoxS/CutS family)